MSEETPRLTRPPIDPAGPAAFVIFGASGDLAKRKLVPALYHMAVAGHLPKDFALVGFARTALDNASYREKLEKDLRTYADGNPDPKILSWLLERSSYVQGEYDDPAAYLRLDGALEEAGRSFGTRGNALFYLATLPSVFGAIASRLHEAGLTRQDGGRWRRLVIEKPFGHDLASARALNLRLRELLQEEQIYRIDHYLGKETVQNILAFRFGNSIYEPIWNQRYIDHIAITATEELGVETRGPFYETAGALRDMVPNHLLQLLTLTAMEPPATLDPEAIRDEKAKVLKAVHILTPEEVRRDAVRGQYGPGTIRGKEVPGYRSEASVAPGSNVETFVALKLRVDNWRWGNVPFYLRTGKRLSGRRTQIVVQFKCPPLRLFQGSCGEGPAPNTLIIDIQPVEGIQFTFLAKAPGPGYHLGKVSMDFNYCDRFLCELNTGYETLLYDALIGDATQFQRQDMTEAGWSIVQPILDGWREEPPIGFPNYAAGTDGPQAAMELMSRDGRAWKTLS